MTPTSNAGLGFRLYRHRGTWRIGRPGSAREASPEEQVLWEERRQLREALADANVREMVAEHALAARRHCLEALRSRVRLVDAVRDLLVALIEWRPLVDEVSGRVETALRENEDAALAAREALGVNDGRDD